MAPYLSLIVPAYNEEKRIVRSVETALDYLGKMDFSWEIIIVDDGSNDDTVGVLDAYKDRVKVISLPVNSGKGAAVRKGMMESKGEICVFTDADFSIPIHEIQKILPQMKEGTEICIASRAVDRSLVKEHQPFYREYMGRIFNWIVQIIVMRGIKDTQCGFKAFSRKAVDMIFPITRIDRFAFDVELLYLARKKGLGIAQVPVEWSNDPRSTVNPIKDSINMIFELFRIRRLHG